MTLSAYALRADDTHHTQGFFLGDIVIFALIALHILIAFQETDLVPLFRRPLSELRY